MPKDQSIITCKQKKYTCININILFKNIKEKRMNLPERTRKRAVKETAM